MAGISHSVPLKTIFGFDPRSIPGCFTWIDASDTSAFTLNVNNVVTGIVDKSTSANTFTVLTQSATVGFQWGTNQFNSGYPAFFTTVSTFNQNSVNLGAASGLSAQSTPLTVFTVGQSDNTVSGTNTFLFDSTNRIAANGPVSTLMNIGTTAGTTIGQPFANVTTPFIMTGVYNNNVNSGSFIFNNGALATTGTLSTQTFGASGLVLGARFGSTQNWYGKICEMLFFSRVLTMTEQQQIEGYLAWKWGLQANLSSGHPYRNTYTSIVRPFLRNFVPTDVSTPCLLWFDGRDASTLTLSGSNVTAWRDKSGNSNNITSFSATQPTYNSSTGILTCTTGTGTTTNSIALTSVLAYSIFYVITFMTLTDTVGLSYARPFALTSNVFFFGTNRGSYTTAVSGATISGSNTVYNVTNTSGLTTGNTVTVAGITLGGATGYNGTGVVQSFVSNTSFTLNITSTGTPTSFSGATARNGTNNVTYYTEGNGGSGPYFFFATGQGFNTYAGTTFICSMTQTGNSTYTLSVNGNASNTTANTATMANRQVVIGSGAGTAFGLGEVLLYDGTLTTQDRQRVEGYLTWKWGNQRTANPGASTNFPTTHPFYRFPTTATTPFNPNFITGLSTWYDASILSGSNGSAVTAWADRSSIGNNLSGGTSPTLVTSGLNGLNVVRFASASSQYLVMSNPNSLPLGTSSASYFAITRTSNSIATQQVFMYGSTPNTASQNVDFGFFSNNATTDIYTAGAIFDGTANNNTFALISNVMTGTSTNAGWVNGTSFSTTNNTSLSTKNIGATGTVAGFVGAGRLSSNIQYFLSGDIAEILIFSGALATTQRQQVEGYLAWKWGLQTLLPTTHPYYRVQI